MSHLRLILCRVEEENPDQMTEIAAFDLPKTDLDQMHPQNALDLLEQQTFENGNALLKRLFQAQWEEVDTHLTQQARQDFSPKAGSKRRK